MSSSGLSVTEVNDGGRDDSRRLPIQTIHFETLPTHDLEHLCAVSFPIKANSENTLNDNDFVDPETSLTDLPGKSTCCINDSIGYPPCVSELRYIQFLLHMILAFFKMMRPQSYDTLWFVLNGYHMDIV